MTFSPIGRLLAVLFLVLPLSLEGQETPTEENLDTDEADATSIEQQSEEQNVEYVVVTGSRLTTGDPTAVVYSLTAEDFLARGVSSVEELIRTLPWTYSSITQQTSAIDSDALAPSDVDKNLRNVDNALSGMILFEVITGFGTSTANLRALGSANTLVLINGRRVAGRAGDEEGFANLLNVPLSAIERVDVQLDGGSAVYGADAIGGVINFITKKNYTGAEFSMRKDFSSTGADRTLAEFQGGYAWGSGQLTGTIQQTEQLPIMNAKTGWTTMDQRDLFGPEFDDRDRTRGQPGVFRKLCVYSWGAYPCGDYFQLRSGHSGENATEDDFTTDVLPVDYVPPQNGEDASNTSMTLFAEYFVTDKFRLFADLLYSEHNAYQEYRTDLSGYLVPEENAFNPFGVDVQVNYLPTEEVAAGVLPGAFHESKNEQRNVNTGFIWDYAIKHQMELRFGSSKSKNFGWQVGYVRPNWLDGGDPSKSRVEELLESSDPNVAINLFGDGSKQSPMLAELASPWIGPHRGITETETTELLLRGELLELPGGSIGYAAGLNTLSERISLEQQDYSDVAGQSETKGLEVILGLEQPKEDLTAFFGELAIPIVGESNARPWLNGLILNLQARNDKYKSTGAFGGVTRVREAGVWVHNGEPNIVTLTNSHTSPRIGIRYEPTEDLAVQFSWTESFRPPVFSDTFHILEPREDTVYVADPYDVEGGPPCLAFGCQVRRVTVYGVGDNLKPEIADTYAWNFEWVPSNVTGLRLTMHWSKVDFTDKIEYSYNLLFTDPENAFLLPEIVERDAEGNAIRVFARYINISEKVSEILTSEIEYTFTNELGLFRPRLSYTRVLEEYFRIVPESNPVNRVGTTWGSNEYGLIASLAWTSGKYSADLFVRYTPSYTNDRTGTCREVIGRCERLYGPRPTMEVDPFTSVDLTVRYQFNENLPINGGGRNIFNAEPPLTSSGGRPYDLTRYDARGRVLFLEATYIFDGS